MERLDKSGWLLSKNFSNYFKNERRVRYHGGADEVTLIAQGKADGAFYVVKHKDSSVWGDRVRDQYRRVSPAFVKGVLGELPKEHKIDDIVALRARLYSPRNYFMTC